MKKTVFEKYFLKTCSVITAACFLLTSIGGNLSASAVPSGASDFDAVFDNLNIISPEYGKITSVSDSLGDITVINIQDLHCHERTQRNISEIIKTLDKKYKLKSVFVEGGYGPIDISWIDKIQDSNAKQLIIEQMIKEGYLTGAEYYAIKNNKHGFLNGIEDKNTHERNLKRLSLIIENQKKYKSLMLKINNEIEVLDNMYLNDRNKRFSLKINRYKAGQTDSLKYYRMLVKYAGKIKNEPEKYNNIVSINLEDYPNILGYIDLSRYSKNVNPVKVSAELQMLVNTVKNKIPYSSYRKLVEQTDNFRDTQALTDFLVVFCRMNNINLSKEFKDLNAFFKVSALSNRINPVELVNEERTLTEQIRMALSYDATEYEIAYINDFSKHFGDYLSYSLTSSDWNYFKLNFAKFRQIYSKYASVDRINEISDDFVFLNEYYETNDLRNHIFVSNILKNEVSLQSQSGLRTSDDILKQSKEVIVVVSGGYHSQSLQSIFSSKNINSMVITPNVTGDVSKADDTYGKIIKEQASVNSNALAFKLASCLSDPEQKSLLAKMAVDALGIENAEKLKNMIRADIDLANIKTEVPYSDKQKKINEIIKTAVNAMVSAIPQNGGRNIFNPDIDNILIEMSLKLYDMGFYFENGTVYEIDSSEYKDKDLLGIPAEVYSKMFGSLQKAMLKAEQIRDGVPTAKNIRIQWSSFPDKAFMLIQEVLFRALPAFIIIFNPVIGVPLFILLQMVSLSLEIVVQWKVYKSSSGNNPDFLKKYVNKLFLITILLTIPYAVVLATNIVYLPIVFVATIIMHYLFVKKFSISKAFISYFLLAPSMSVFWWATGNIDRYRTAVKNRNDKKADSQRYKLKTDISYETIMRDRNNSASLENIIKNEKLDVKYRLFALMYFKTNNIDISKEITENPIDKEITEKIKKDFKNSLQKNKIKNNFDLQSNLTGIFLILDDILKEQIHGNSYRIYEEIQDAVIVRCGMSNTAATADFTFVAVDYETLAHEIGHRILRYSSMDDNTTLGELFAETISNLIAQEFNIIPAKSSAQLYGLFDSNVNYIRVFQEEHDAADGFLNLIKESTEANPNWLVLIDTIINYGYYKEGFKRPSAQGLILKDILTGYEEALKQTGESNIVDFAKKRTAKYSVVVDILKDIKEKNPDQYDKILKKIRSKAKIQQSYKQENIAMTRFWQSKSKIEELFNIIDGIFSPKKLYDFEIISAIFSSPDKIDSVLNDMFDVIFKDTDYSMYDFENLYRIKLLMAHDRTYASKEELEKNLKPIIDLITSSRRTEPTNDDFINLKKSKRYTLKNNFRLTIIENFNKLGLPELIETLFSQKISDETNKTDSKLSISGIQFQQQTTLPDSHTNGEEYTSVTLSENEDSSNHVDEEPGQKSVVYDERFDNLLKYVNRLGGETPVIGSSESAVYRRRIQTVYSIMVKEIDLNYMQQVYEDNNEAQGIIKYLQMLKLKNLKDRESLISIVRNPRFDIKYRLTAFMYLKMEGYDDSEYDEILKNDFLINLKNNSLDIKNNFDLSAMGAGVMLVLSLYLKGKGYINATREKEIYERISESVFLAKSKWNNTEANSGMFFTTPNPLTIAHEIGHRVLMFYADITKGSSYSTAHEIFADIIAYVFAEKAGIEGKSVFDALYELYNPKMNYDYVMQEEHRAAIGLIYLVTDIAKRMGKQVKLDFLADAIIKRIVSVAKLPQRQPDAIKEFISEYENILKEKGIYNNSEIEQFESILRQETWKTKVFELFALLRNSNGTRWDYYGETYGNIINRIRVEVAEPESYKFGAVLADYSNDLVVVNNIIMSQPDKIDAVLEIVKQELSKNEYLFRSQIAKIIFADLMIYVPQMKKLTKNQIDMIIQHAVDEHFSTKTEYAVSEIDYSKIRKDALFEYALIEAVSSYGNGIHSLKKDGGYFKNGYYAQDMRTDKYFKYSESLPHFVPTIDTFFISTGIIKIYRKFFDFVAHKTALSKEYKFKNDISYLTILRDSDNERALKKIIYNNSTDVRYKLFALMYLKKNGVNDIDESITDSIKKKIINMFHTGRMQVRNNFELRAVLTGVSLLLEDFSRRYINENKETELYKAISEAVVLRRGKEDIGARANFAFVSVDPLSMAHELGHRILSSSFEGGFKEITIHELFAETVSNLFAQIVTLEGRGYRSSLYGLFNSEFNYEDVFQEEHRAAIGFIELIKDISGSIGKNIRWETLADAVIKYVSASALDIAETDQGVNLKNIFIEYLKQLNNKKQYTKDDLRFMFNMAHTVTKGEIVVIEILKDIKRENPVQYENILEVIKAKIKPQTSYMKKLFGKKLKYTGDDEVLARLIFSQPKNIQPVLRIIRAEILKTGNYNKYDFTNLIKLEFLIRNPNKIYSSKKELDKDTYRMAEYIIKIAANDAYHGVYKTFNYTDYQYVQSYMNGTSGGQNGIDSYFRDSSHRMTMTWLDNLLLSFGKTDFNERQKIVAAVEYPIIVLGMFFPKIRNWFLSKHKTGDISQIEVQLTKLENTTVGKIKNILKIEINDISSLSFIKKLAILSKILANKTIKVSNMEEHLKLNEVISDNQKLPAKTESIKWILILSISTALLIAIIFHFSVLSFVFMIFPITSFVTLCWSLLKPQSDKIYGKEKYESEYFSNIPETDYDYSQGPTTSVTVQIPVYKESNEVIFNTIMQSIKACAKYSQKSGARANIVISDDGLAVLLNGNISKGNIENLLREENTGKLTKTQRQAIERIKFYRANNISFVARPEKHRKGFFKKASNLNHTYKVINSLSNSGTFDDGTYYEGDSLFIGDIILLLDKDSQLHEDVISVTIPKFIKDDKLAFTQNSTLPSNESDNYFTRFLAPFTTFLFQHIFSANAISGGLVPFVGHNGFIRKKCLEEIKNWPENRVSEDFYTSIKFQTRGYRGMYLSFKGYEFKEMVSRSFIEESNKILRYAFGLLELIFNRQPARDNGGKKGILTDWMKDFLKSENIKWYQKINFFIYPLSYVNLISVIPMTLISLLFKKIIISQFSLLFLIFTIPFVLVMYKIYKENSLPNQTKDSDINIIFKILLNIVSISVMFISFSYSVLKGLWKFISKKKPEFPATNIDEENYNLKRAFDEMKQHFNENRLVFLFLIPWLLITFAVKPVFNAAFIASLFYITAFPFASIVLSPFLLKAVKQAFNVKIQNIRLNFKIYDELNLFADKIPDENIKELNIFIVKDLTKFEHKCEFINTGIKVNGKTIWQIDIDGMLVFGAKDVNIQEIAQALNGSKILEKKIKKILQLNKKVRLDIDSVIVDEQSEDMFFYGRTAVINTNQYTKTVAKILDSISVMYAQKTIISLENISDNDLYSALNNGALRKVITVAQFEYLKKEFERSGKDISREMLELRKRGIEIYLSAIVIDEQYKDFGISGQIVENAIYDYYSREAVEIELIKEKISLQQLENKIINSDKPLLIEMNLLKEIFRTTKDIIETYNGLQSLLGSIKIRFGLKDIKIKDMENFAYSIDFSDLPIVREDEIMINTGIDNFCDVMGLEKDNIIRIILEDTKINEDVKQVFFNIIKEMILAKTKLSESNKPNGLKDKKMEILLGKLLFLRYSNADKATLLPEIDSFKGSEEDMIHKINELYAQFAADNDPRIINTMIELIVIYCEECGDKEIQEMNDINRTDSYRKMLAAA